MNRKTIGTLMVLALAGLAYWSQQAGNETGAWIYIALALVVLGVLNPVGAWLDERSA